jgi:beta-lactamase class D
MKKRGLFVATIILMAATGVYLATSKERPTKPQESQSKISVRKDLERYFSDAGTQGTVLVKQQDVTTVVNEDRSRQAYVPSSTFKIPNSLIALQENVVSGPEEIMKGPHEKLMVDGKSFLPAICEGDVTFKQAFQNSCVTIYQEIARKIPIQTYQDYINKMHYGNMNISSVAVDKFWLEGDLAITPSQQVDFLQKLYEGKLPFSKKVMDDTKTMMFVESINGAKIYGKSGWVFSHQPNVGWWVGWVEKNNKATFFAINLDILKPEQASARTTIAKQILRDLHVLD